MRYRLVDVFSSRPLAGNALCVVLDPCPEDRMQAVAREMNLSETTFLTSRGDGEYSMRIFTPGIELSFAGHPTLGTAWCMGPGRWRQRTSGAEVTVTVDAGGAEMIQPDPVITAVDAGADAAAALGIGAVRGTWTAEAAGNRHVVVATEGSLSDWRIDATRALALMDAQRTSTIAVVERVDDTTLHVRVVFRANGVAEDPGTGSAAGPVALVARELWDCAADLVIHQGDEIGRPCRLRVHAERGDLRVAGDVSLCAEGEFRF